MHHRVAQRDLSRRVPDCDVGIGADGNRSLARMQIVDLCRCGRGQFDELLEAQAALRNHGVEQQRQPYFEARQTVCHLLEIGIGAGAQFSGLIEPVRRVIG
jgi:hypothetical protein